MRSCASTAQEVRKVMTVTFLRENEVVPLLPGEELCINYSGGKKGKHNWLYISCYLGPDQV